MVYLLDKDHLRKDSIDNVGPSDGARLCTVGFEELREVGKHLGIGEKTIEACFRSENSNFESHDGFDFLTLNIPDDRDQRRKPHRVGIYFTDSLLVFISDRYDLIDQLIASLMDEGVKNISLGRIISLFFDRLTFDDALIMEKMEQNLTELEEELLQSREGDLIEQLAAYRKRLRTLKRYYEQLLEISEAIEQNENGLIEKSVLRYFRFHTGRVNRLYSGVLSLREYVTQVREAYQAQIDINLNKVMKFFTVITSVFLPLTLIAGWYGMNLKMPEFGWEHGYLFVIVLSATAAAATLFYFKKNKWF